MKLYTEVQVPRQSFQISLKDRILVLGSCFADEMGAKMLETGFRVCINPFGTLYNPSSVLKALRRLSDGTPFAPSDCIQMGAGAGKVCSFSHHTSFARENGEDLLANANASLREASAFLHGCNRLIITLGTSMVWKWNGETVSNCLKRPEKEFTHEMMSLEEVEGCIRDIISLGIPTLFTVSPIRHLSRGAAENTISKATLQLALRRCGADYFPASEILLDELRDYRFYADDLCHPSRTAVECIWEKFSEACIPGNEADLILQNRKDARRQAHRSILK